MKKVEITEWYLKMPFIMAIILHRCIDDLKNINSYGGVYFFMMCLFGELRSDDNDILLSEFRRNYKIVYNSEKMTIFDNLIDNPYIFYKIPLPGTNDYVISPVFDFWNMTAAKLMKMQKKVFTHEVTELHKLSPYRGRVVEGYSSESSQASVLSQAKGSAEASAESGNSRVEKEISSDNERVILEQKKKSGDKYIVIDKDIDKEKENNKKKNLDCSDTTHNEFNLEECVKSLPLEDERVQNALKRADKNEAELISGNWEIAKDVFYEICFGRQGDKLTCERDVLKYFYNFIGKASTREDFIKEISKRINSVSPSHEEDDPYRFEERDSAGNRFYDGIPIPPGMPPRPTVTATIMNDRWRF